MQGKITWTQIIAAGSLALALLTTAWSIVRYEVNEVRRDVNGLKEFTAQGRSAIQHEVVNLHANIEQLRTTKADNTRLDRAAAQLVSAAELIQRDEVLQKQIDALAGRLNKLEKDHTAQ